MGTRYAPPRPGAIHSLKTEKPVTTLLQLRRRPSARMNKFTGTRRRKPGI
ncbi:hypothetical protein WJU16_08695 [Chitinophaga pollutisoli]|uniref:Uncharacterized protein n=1 Tax=Chitinophaga pollutisoli TaxID=3133966 RepID=A0ABZ2YUC2_9BACT